MNEMLLCFLEIYDVGRYISYLPPVVQYEHVLKSGYDGFCCCLSLRPLVLEDSACAMTSLVDAAVVCFSIYLSQLGI